jgi:hypothetical protein
MQTKYLTNTLDHTLTLKQGEIVIKSGESYPVDADDLKEQTIKYSLIKKWARLDDQPSTSLAVKEEISFAADPFKGLSLEELQAEKAKKAAEKEEPAAYGSLLGQGAQVEVTNKVKTEQIGDPAKAEKAKPTKATKTKEAS